MGMLSIVRKYRMKPTDNCHISLTWYMYTLRRLHVLVRMYSSRAFDIMFAAPMLSQLPSAASASRVGDITGRRLVKLHVTGE